MSSNSPITPEEGVELKTVGTCVGPGAKKSSFASVDVTERGSMFGDLAVQIITLTKKNFLIQRRATTATATQLLIGVIFLGLLRLMQLSIESNPVFAQDFYEVDDPKASTVELPHKCFPHAWNGGSCYSFVISPNGSSPLGLFAADVAKRMATDADFGERGEKFGWEAFESPDYVDDWLFNNVNATPVAVLFHGDGSHGKVGYSLQYNDTATCNTIGVLDCNDPKRDFMASFTRLVDQSVLRVKSHNPDASIGTAFSDFPHPAGTLDWDVMQRYGNDWLYIAVVFNFVIQLQSVVMEKERHLRASMQQMGLRRTAYWVSWFISCEVMNLFVVLLLCAFGNLIQMEFFLDNGFDVYFTLFFLTSTAFTLFAFLCSTFISNAEGARSFGILWYIVTFIAVPLIVILVFSSSSEKFKPAISGISLIAAAPFFKGVGDLITASSGGRGKGMQWERKGGQTDLTSFSSDIDYAYSGGFGGGGTPFYTTRDAMEYLIYCCLLYAAVTWYLDHVVPNDFGLSHKLWFFLDPNYWGFRGRLCGMQGSSLANKARTAIPDSDLVDASSDPASNDADVVAEAKEVRLGAYEERSGEVALEIKGLQKMFVSRVYEWLPSNSWAGALTYGALPALVLSFAFAGGGGFALLWLVFVLLLKFTPFLSFRFRLVPTNKVQSFAAVRGVSYAVEDESLFVLLGHNGAGKSTTFNMLTGLMPLSGGDCTIFGMSVKHEMHLITKVMGVCPQHDVLWDNLTGREHLELFARLKGIPDKDIPGEVDARLADVKLEEAGSVQSGAYSGGMQRRLSLAIALLGNPKIVFLDEPTTGMDPVTRRSVWDCISRAKKGRVIVLTTHSMEEADILGDRVAIMSGGKLSCIGSSLHLKHKFGGGFRLSMMCAGGSDKVEALKQFVVSSKAFQGVKARFVSATQGMCLFRLGTQDAAVLTPFFEALEASKEKLGVTDVSIGNATLDDVFINLALGKHEGDDPRDADPKDDPARRSSLDEEDPAAPPGGALVVVATGGGPTSDAKLFTQRGPTSTGTPTTTVQPAAGGAAASGGAKPNEEESGCCEAKPLKDCRVCCLSESAFCFDCGCFHGCCCECCCKCQAGTESAAKAEKKKKKEEKLALEAESSSTSAAESPKKMPQGQVYALLQKSLSFQLRQKKLMCCLIMFPTIFIALIALLGTLVFNPLTENSLNKLDWACVQKGLLVTEFTGPSISVGAVSEKNPKYENDDWPPLYGLESPSYEFFVSGDVGGAGDNAATEGAGSKVAGLVSSFGSYRSWMGDFKPYYDCTKAYDKSYDKYVITRKNSVKEDNDNPASIGYAEEWDEHGNESYVKRPASCKKTRVGLKIPRQLLTPPTAANEAKYKSLQSILGSCEKGSTPNNVFTNATAVMAAQTGLQNGNSGLLQHLSFAPILERRALGQFNAMMYTAYYGLGSTLTCSLGGSNSSKDCNALASSLECSWNWLGTSNCDYTPPEIKSGTPSGVFTNVASLFCSQKDVPTAATSSYREALATALESDGGDRGGDRVDSFCGWFGSMDAVRGMRSTNLGLEKSSLNKALKRDWEGVYDPTSDTSVTKFTSLHFKRANLGDMAWDYVAYFNLTGLCGLSGGADEFCDVEDDTEEETAPSPNYQLEKPVTSMILALQTRVDAAIFKQALGLELEVDTKNFPKKLDKCAYDFFGCRSITDFIASAFLPYIFMLYIFVIQGLVVFEKSSKLRDIMVMSGLKMRVYWTVLWAFYFAQYLFMVLILWVAGVLTELRTFTIHDPGVLLLYFITWGNCMIAFAFLLTTFFKSPVTATVVTLLVTILSVQAGSTVLTQLVLDPNLGDNEIPYLPYMWFPPLVLLRGLLWLTYGAAFDSGVTWPTLVTYGRGGLFRSMLYMWVETVAMVGLTWYFDIVLADNARPFLFFVDDFKEWYQERKEGKKRGKFIKKASKQEGGGEKKALGAAAAAAAPPQRSNEPADVKQERERVEGGGEDQAVRVLGFRKVFPGAGNNGSDKVAVEGLSFAVNHNECFGLLGHNGAGKTTTISMLCGLFKPTSGEAVVAGFDLSSEMASIHENMGVCPQHDILWNDLTAREHLLFYARLRKIPGDELNAAVNKALAAVNLSEWGDVLSSKFSGGMKRRLSTACSLVGEPKVVYMDEPSTGLDPASRHRLWEVIAQSKGKNSILLTTHSMEEADVLCERIGIMGAGHMLCLGTSLDLKSRFGAGYRLSLHIKDKGAEAALACGSVVTKLCPSAKLLNDPMGGIMDYEVPRAEVRLSVVYSAIEAHRDTLGILDWGITESTLEEVFLAVTGHDSHKGVVPDAKNVAAAHGDVSSVL